MRTGDLIDVLCEYGDMPMTIWTPNGKRAVICKIETFQNTEGKGIELQIDLGEISDLKTNLDWQGDFTGL